MVFTYQDNGSYERKIESIWNYTIKKEELIIMKDKFWQKAVFVRKKGKIEKEKQIPTKSEAGACLAMCLKYEQIEPGFFCKHVLVKKMSVWQFLLMTFKALKNPARHKR